MAIRQVIEAVAEALQVPVDLPALTLLPCVGVCIAQKFEVLAREGWREVPAIWTLCLLKSGERKSATFSEMISPILEWEREQAEALRPTIQRLTEQRKVAEARLAHQRKIAAKAKPADVRAATDRCLELAAERDEIIVPTSPCLYVSNATTEALTTVLVENQERALVASPEADALDVMMGRYDDKGQPNMGIWLKGHAGDAERVVRKSRPAEYLARPILSVAMVVQPESVRGMLTSRIARGKGLLARFLTCAPFSRLGSRKTGGEAEPIPPDLRDRYERMIRALLDLPIDPEDGPQVIGLDAAATDLFTQFESRIEAQLGPTGALGDRGDWGGKICGAVLRIALVLSVLRWADQEGCAQSARSAPPIDESTMRAALSWVPYLVEHERIVSGVAGCDRDGAVAERLINWMRPRAGQTLTRREAFSENRSALVQTVDDIDGPLALVEEFGYIRPLPAETGPRPGGGRRPSMVFEINPRWERGGAQ